MSQKQIVKPKAKASSTSAPLEIKLPTKAVEEVVKQPQDRKVRLVYSSCCGCGCTEFTLERKVPFDSPLKDGDRVRYREDNDKILS